MKNKSTLFIILFLLSLICCKEPVESKIEKSVLIPFSGNKGFNNKGMPLDSLSDYFPDSIFTDSVKYYINRYGGLINPIHMDKELYTLIHKDITIDQLKDTIVVETDTITDHFASVSYMLYKMGEPSLSHHYLGNDIYRIISLRSFHRPFIIRVEKENNKINIYYKMLNREITYPFMVLSDKVVIFEPPQIDGEPPIIIDYEEQYKIAKRETDSLVAIYNNTNYYNIINENINVSHNTWDSLEVIVDSSKFWKSKPQLYLNHVQIDGSKWIIEGHTKQGYQVKRIPSPHFKEYEFSHGYDKNNYYACIFKLLAETVKMQEELY